MPLDLSKVLVVGISSRALFELTEANAVFEGEGLDAYIRYQLEREDEVLPPGAGFPLVRAMLALNEVAPGGRRCEVVILSKNSPDLSLRISRSIEHYGLDITRAAFVSGAPLAPYLNAFSVDLFLSRDAQDVQAAVDAGVAAAEIYPPPGNMAAPLDQIRIAFDADAVVFSDESERIYKEKGLEAFLDHEKANAKKPLKDGPFAKLFRAIAVLQAAFPKGETPIRTAIVTARNSPAHERVIRTLRVWGVRLDEVFFLGGVPKAEILRAFGAHMFFDDQDLHCAPASKVVPTARVPGPYSMIKVTPVQ